MGGGSTALLTDRYELTMLAAALADGADVVIGPVEDGGYVLIGMSRPRPELLLQMTWSTVSVHAETLRRAEGAGLHTIVLPQLWDVDDAAGLHRWREWETVKPDR